MEPCFDPDCERRHKVMVLVNVAEPQEGESPEQAYIRKPMHMLISEEMYRRLTEGRVSKHSTGVNPNAL